MATYSHLHLVTPKTLYLHHSLPYFILQVDTNICYQRPLMKKQYASQKNLFCLKNPQFIKLWNILFFFFFKRKKRKEKKVVSTCPHLLSASVTKPRIILQHLPTVSSKTNDGVPCNPTLSAVSYWGKQNSFLNVPHPLAYKSQQQLIPTLCTKVVKICGNRRKVSGNNQEKIPSVEQHEGMCIKRLYHFWPWKALYQTTNYAF